MRIVQLSDIHLSASNKKDLTIYYLDSLIKDLLNFHNDKNIDAILLTGDLVDKGGDSLGKDRYGVFNKLFIEPLKQKLNLQNNQIFLIPGNHDINRNAIDVAGEYYLASHLNKETANSVLKEQKSKLTSNNKRIKIFKSFEQKFHEKTENYEFSYNESLALLDQSNSKIGFALINDSWRCSTSLTQEQHFIGTDQLLNAKSYFESHKTLINIAVFHHPLDAINPLEKESIESILQSLEFDIAFFGHSHKYKYESIISSNGGILMINGRSAFNNPNEAQSRYQSGYNILDLDVLSREYTIHARKYIDSQYRFDKDVDSFPDGKKSGILTKPTYVSLINGTNREDKDLPSGYSADVNKIVKLLIGKSLYPNQYVFVRELVQNSVDACNRIKEKYSYSSPKIILKVNSSENSFEIIDEGDGMSKKALKEHFSIIGKSISQEFGDTVDSVNLISQFGIGFISTFIVAQKIFISTKSESDGLINFEIEDVFKGFDYSTTIKSDYIESIATGTSVKLFLKSNFGAISLLHIVTSYCRHIEQLEFHLDNSLHILNSNWNLENGMYFHTIKNSKFECRLTISNTLRHLVASNGGFLINYDSRQIVPSFFPHIIGGEVVFQPKAIDLDLSRSNIIESNKSVEFKKEISIVLRILFRAVTESSNLEQRQLVINYLQFYLSSYDTIQSSIRESYSDFYSKRELIELCSDLTTVLYFGVQMSLRQILMILNNKNIKTVYYYAINGQNELREIVTEYLTGQGYLITYPNQIAVQFREGGQMFNTQTCFEIIVRSAGLDFIDIYYAIPSFMEKIIIGKIDLPYTLNRIIERIEQQYNFEIKIAHLGPGYKLLLEFVETRYINYDHLSFQSLLANFERVSEEHLEVYLLGILCVDVSLFMNGKFSAS